MLVRAQAFAENAPHRDLWLSPDHAVFVDGVLIPIRQLINGTTIEQVPVDKVSYYHVELPRHDVLFAEGLPAESYLDTGNRGTFANAGSAIDLYPMFDAPKTWRDDAAAPLAGDEARVKPVWERLAARSRALGQPTPSVAFTGDAAVRLQVDGRLLRPVTSTRHWCRFVLPQRASSIRLLSRSGYPTDARPWLDDGRRLGVYVSRIVWNDGDGPHDMPVDHPALREGWWDVERAGTLLRRWTDGVRAAATLARRGHGRVPDGGRHAVSPRCGRTGVAARTAGGIEDPRLNTGWWRGDPFTPSCRCRSASTSVLALISTDVDGGPSPAMTGWVSLPFRHCS